MEVVEPGFPNPYPVLDAPHFTKQHPSISESTSTIALQEDKLIYNCSALSECSVELTLPPPGPSLRQIEALIIVSERCKNKELLDILYSISMYNHNNTCISLTCMGDETNQGKIASDVLECALKRSPELFLLCVVNKEFEEEWEGKGVSNSLVYCVQLYLKGMIHHSKEVRGIIVLWQEESYFEYLPINLKACTDFRIDKAEDISQFIAGQPEYIMNQ